MSLLRHHNSPELLAAFIEERRYLPFAWGSNDCGLFLADAVVAMTGFDLAAWLRGYKTARGAERRVAKAGGMRQLALQSRFVEKPTSFAQRGDGTLAVLEGRDTLGVCLGTGKWCAPGRDGLVFRPMSEVIVALAF